MLPKDQSSWQSNWVFLCTVISQGQHANFKSLQPTSPAGLERRKNLCERNICAFKLFFFFLLSGQQMSLKQIRHKLVTASFCACEGAQRSVSEVQCHGLSSAASPFRKTASQQVERHCSTNSPARSETENVLYMKISLHGYVKYVDYL